MNRWMNEWIDRRIDRYMDRSIEKKQLTLSIVTDSTHMDS